MSETEQPRPPVLTLKAQISPETAIFVETTSLAELARVMAIFNLVPPAPEAQS